MNALNYHHLRYFWAIAHDGNLTRTATRLHITQSALSIQIRKLEEQLGHRLFERVHRQLRLTEAGRIVLDHADNIFKQGHELLNTLKQGHQQRQILRVGALATLSRNFQIDFLRPLLERKDVELLLHAGNAGQLIEALVALDLDVVLVNHAPQKHHLTTLITHTIADQPVSLIAHPQRLAGREPQALSQLLASQPLILPSQESGIRIHFDALINRLDLRPQIAAEVDDMAMMRLLARENIGLAVLPPIVVKDELQAGTLVEVTQLPDLAEYFYAVTSQRRFANPLLQTLLREKC